MKVFSQINESSSSTFVLTQKEYDDYSAAIEQTKRSKEFLHVMWIISKYPLLFDKENLQKVIDGHFFKDVDDTAQKDIQRIVKKIGDEAKLLPPMLSAEQRQMVIDKRIDANDLTLDLESNKGRDTIAKKYMPLVEKMVHQFDGKCPLSKEELRSAALMGLTLAMNEYKNPEEMEKAGLTGNQSFTQYAAYRIKQQILKDINNNSTNVRIGKGIRKQMLDAGETVNKEFSIDQIFGKDDDGEPISIDRFLGLGAEDDQLSYREREEFYKKIFKRIESKFSARDCNMFYRVWGINGFKREKVKDIAKELGISEPAVTQACKRIIKFASDDKEIQSYKDAFESLMNEYIYQKMLEVYNCSQEEIVESFIYDDMYILLENINKWNNKDKFIKAVSKATDMLSVDDALYIYKVLQSQVDIDVKDIKKYHGAIVEFLSNMAPEKAYKKADDSTLINELNEYRAISGKFAIKW